MFFMHILFWLGVGRAEITEGKGIILGKNLASGYRKQTTFLLGLIDIQLDVWGKMDFESGCPKWGIIRFLGIQ